ncbi:hypothetical protein SADUNF_Sadunf04G0084700 [Salix dunnii]|uniref:AB hydrolase-1 domain-containing protein n=1 Tax=Salix dunnii TaxID=1413687 RepID=A0A835KFC5_9ROSI|nr:hypothetical protein SADUNF_Sadunf04G0084700 [Salix dunnii]
MSVKTETFVSYPSLIVMAAISLLSLFHPDPSIPKMATKPLAVLNKAYKMQVPYELKQGQTRLFHQLPSGLNMEVIEQKGLVLEDKENNGGPRNSERNPPLVFVHGSYHAAWCWAEHWLPFFSGFGFDSYAVSLLGQGESDAPASPVAGSLQTHAGDVADFIQKKLTFPPVLLGHSFGGLIIQCYVANIRNKQTLEKKMRYPDLAGAVLVCSVPPSGNSGLVWRYLFSKPVAAFKVTRSLAAKAFQTNLSLCKETFFTSTMDDHLVKRYQALMKESSRMPLFDLRKLNSSLPVPSVPKSSIEVLVLGANDDFIVIVIVSYDYGDFVVFLYPNKRAGYVVYIVKCHAWRESNLRNYSSTISVLLTPSDPSILYSKPDPILGNDTEGLNETGRFYGVSPICVEGVAHDMMLDCSWEKGARAILSWLNCLSR